MECIGVLTASTTDHARGAGHPEGRAAELDFQSALCPDTWGKHGWKLQGTPFVMPGFSGQHKVGCLPGVIVVLPLDEGSGTLKAGEVHGVNSIHPFHNHLDRGHTHR